MRGRHWLLAWLGVFLVVAVAVTARQTAAFRLAQELGSLEVDTRTLEAQRAELQRRITRATSRSVLLPKAQRDFGLTIPEGQAYRLIRIAPPLPED